uniref:Kinesin-like protein Kif23 Arf6-interacting domain-containing protein n=1 Tax=Timema douglasi TaxID=61478 RepID=A0A7R8VLZ4_TIMDO|nr:unnamed protein product [Timema douglasi]
MAKASLARVVAAVARRETLSCLWEGVDRADVVPTSGGGAQVIFNDLETLKQRSPLSPGANKRSAEEGTVEHSERQARCILCPWYPASLDVPPHSLSNSSQICESPSGGGHPPPPPVEVPYQ